MLSRSPLSRIAAVFIFSCFFSCNALVLSAADIEIALDYNFDTIGDQIGTVQIYRTMVGGVTYDRPAFGIYDTGASVISISAEDQDAYANSSGMYATVPTIPGATTSASGVGGDLTGAVSQPGTIIADGMHAFNYDTFSYSFTSSATVSNIQAFVGTPTGSASLPTITGTPIHNPYNASASAALIDMRGYTFDLGSIFTGLSGYDEFNGITMTYPDLSFVSTGTTIAATTETTSVAKISLSYLGVNNWMAEGKEVTSSPNPVQTDVKVTYTPTGQTASNTQTGKTFLFDTGAQMSIVSESLLRQLGVDPDTTASFTTMAVQGASGASVNLKGYILSSLELPLSDGSGYLRFTNVPVFMLDEAYKIDGIDGILGMNLFNTADKILYDPTASASSATLSLTFLKNPVREEDLSSLFDAMLNEAVLQNKTLSSSTTKINLGTKNLNDLTQSDLEALLSSTILSYLTASLTDTSSTSSSLASLFAELGIDINELGTISGSDLSSLLSDLGLDLGSIELTTAELNKLYSLLNIQTPNTLGIINTAVPEPATYVLVLFALACGWMYRRSRN